MTLKVVGAGLGRTGTNSLKQALEKLTGAPCYHMLEVFGHPEHVPVWHAAARGEMPDWHEFLAGYESAVDWPAASFWPELSQAFPDAFVLLSIRDPEQWWDSVTATIMQPLKAAFDGESPAEYGEWPAMIRELFTSRFTTESDKDAFIAAFEKSNARVRASISPDRLVEWSAADGWPPLCEALNVPVPDEPFPWTNKREDWGKRSD